MEEGHRAILVPQVLDHRDIRVIRRLGGMLMANARRNSVHAFFCFNIEWMPRICLDRIRHYEYKEE